VTLSEAKQIGPAGLAHKKPSAQKIGGLHKNSLGVVSASICAKILMLHAGRVQTARLPPLHLRAGIADDTIRPALVSTVKG
jgi:hypothetical protein